MLVTKAGTFLNAPRSVSISSGTWFAAITSIEIANANAASIKVSSRVISIPRNRNPRNRGNASRFTGTVEAISSCRSSICRESYATQCYVCKDFLTFVFYFLIFFVPFHRKKFQLGLRRNGVVEKEQDEFLNGVPSMLDGTKLAEEISDRISRS